MSLESSDAVANLFDALAQGDLDRARRSFTADAVIWHGFDQKPGSVDELMASFGGMIAGTTERGVADVRRPAASDALIVQQHLFYLRTASGDRRVWPVCIVATLAGGRIARLDEYIDRQGCFTQDSGPLQTPGF